MFILIIYTIGMKSSDESNECSMLFNAMKIKNIRLYKLINNHLGYISMLLGLVNKCALSIARFTKYHSSVQSGGHLNYAQILY